MKVIKDCAFKEEFPETYTWGRISSIKYSDLANTICNHIEHDIRNNFPENRDLTPGLRKALLIIAEKADI